MCRFRRPASATPPSTDKSKTMLEGSGTETDAVVIVASSSTKEVPAGSPVIVTLEMPLGKFTARNSFGPLPGSPKQIGPGSHPTLIEKADVDRKSGGQG